MATHRCSYSPVAICHEAGIRSNSNREIWQSWSRGAFGPRSVPSGLLEEAQCSECLRRGLADEIRYSIVPVLIGEGIPFFADLGKDIALHLAENTAYRNGMVELRYEVHKEQENILGS